MLKLILFFYLPILVFAQGDFLITEEAIEKEGVPKGQVLGPYFNSSKLLADTEHTFWLYIPANYSSIKPPGLTIVLDGFNMAVKNWKLPTILDNLQVMGKIPSTIGLFISPGVILSSDSSMYNKPNRSVEYDGTGKLLGKIILEEILPEISKKYVFSMDPNDHIVLGNSSGGNAAFNLAWEYPDFVSRVFSGIGSFTGLRSGHDFPVLIRKTHHSPLRVFLQDGKKDLNNFSGAWWWVNQHMASSLEWAGHAVKTAWGEEGHNSNHGAAIMPEVLTWLWEGYPAPNEFILEPEREIDFLKSKASWEKVLDLGEEPHHLKADISGNIFVSKGNTIFQLIENVLKPIQSFEKNIVCFECTEDKGFLIAFRKKDKVEKYSRTFQKLTEYSGVQAHDLLTYSKGFYWLDSINNELAYYVDGQKHILKLPSPVGLSINPEKSFLHVNTKASKQGQLVGLNENGVPKWHRDYFYYQVNYPEYESLPNGTAIDVKNNHYSATQLGIQICDQLGRVQLIIPLPNQEVPVAITFGDKDFSMLYVLTANSLYQMSTNTMGFKSTQNLPKPPKPMHINRP